MEPTTRSPFAWAALVFLVALSVFPYYAVLTLDGRSLPLEIVALTAGFAQQAVRLAGKLVQI